MNKYYFTEEHELFRQSLRTFLEKEVAPNIEKWEEERRTPRDIWKKMGDMGFLGLSYPEEYGGSNLDFFYDVVFNEEICRMNSGGFAITQQVVQYMSCPNLLKYGSEFLKQKYLPGIISGDLISSIGITEPGAGSDAQNIQTKAIRDGDHYVVNGSKTFITNGIYGDFIITVVKTDPEAGAAGEGISLLLVDSNLEGFSKGKPFKKLGLKESDTCELFFEDVKVPKDHIIGEEGMGFIYMMQELPRERLTIAIQSIGAAHGAIDETIQYVTERTAFKSPIAGFQNTQFKLAELATQLQVYQAYIDKCIRMLSEHKLSAEAASMAKLGATELEAKVMDECLQLHGGYGFIWEYPIARRYANARVSRIYGGTNEIMKLMVSRKLLKQFTIAAKAKRKKSAARQN
ncbi:UNVERIFIED_CONTAM: hypothetical protein GTU68_004857 [Idotea baltica]|nr:hypothetical protein [Idotea baltica]